MNRSVRHAIAVCAAWIGLVAAPVRAQPAESGERPVGRAEVVQRLVEANPDVARAAAAVERARLERAGARGILDPVLDASLSLSHARTPTASGLSNGIATNDRYALTAGIARTFAPGTHVDFTIAQALTRSEFPLYTGFGIGDRVIVDGPDVSTQLTLEVSQPLLRGFGRDIVLLGDALAARTIDVRELEARRAAETAALAAMSGYAELRYAEEELALRSRSLARTERQLEVATAEVEAGQIAPIELDLVRERLASRREALVVARSELDRRSRELGRAIGDGPAEASRYRPLDPLVEPPEVAFSPALCDECSATSPAVGALRSQVLAAELQVSGARDALRPSLAASAGVTQTGLDGGWPESTGQALTFEAPTVFGGVVFSTPLRNTEARSRHEVALADVDNARFEVREAERALCFEVREAIAVLELQAERIALAAGRVEIATRALDAEEQRLQSGLSTVQAGLDALQTVEEAEIASLRVRTDAELAWWQLQFLRGRLVESLAAGPAAR